MSRYQIIAREIQYYIAQVEAEDDEAAKQVGSEMDPRNLNTWMAGNGR